MLGTRVLPWLLQNKTLFGAEGRTWKGEEESWDCWEYRQYTNSNCMQSMEVNNKQKQKRKYSPNMNEITNNTRDYRYIKPRDLIIESHNIISYKGSFFILFQGVVEKFL
jgi:hypothetical protein